MNLFNELQWRGLIKQTTATDLEKLLNDEPFTAYLGIDPTAESLHAGSLMALLTLKRLQLSGKEVIVLAGGFTASIGDPSGKSQERKTLDLATIDQNTQTISQEINKILSCTVVNNLDWFSKMNLVDFFRTVGKSASVNDMLGKDSVKTRLSERDQGVSFTEFSYMLFQAYDFYHLAKEHKVSLQLGGGDQWSNIIMGVSLTRKMLNQEVHGLTFPLLVKSDGTKFGKTESGAIWLNPLKTSPFDFYQYFVNVADKDVIQFLKWLTFLTESEITSLEQSLKNEPEKRQAQKALARAVTTIVHGPIITKEVEAQTAQLFQSKDWSQAKEDLVLPLAEVINTSLIELLVKMGLSSSKGAARRDIEGHGIKIGEQKVSDVSLLISPVHLIQDRLVLRKGKSNFKIIKVT